MGVRSEKPGLRARVIESRVARSIRRYGLVGAARKAIHYFKTAPARRRAARHDRIFDQRFGIETANVVPLVSLDIDSPNVNFGSRYQASDPDEFRMLIRLLPVEPKDNVFIDFGSGKGRALLLAAEMNFRRVIGVEFSAELNAIAASNVRQFERQTRHSRIELVTADAACYVPPPEPSVLYFFNPFSDHVLRTVVDQMRASMREHPRRVFMVFAGPRLPFLLEQEDLRSVAQVGPHGAIFELVC